MHARKAHHVVHVTAGMATRGLVTRAVRVRERFVFPLPAARRTEMAGLR